jgi:hypothetical protein
VGGWGQHLADEGVEGPGQHVELGQALQHLQPVPRPGRQRPHAAHAARLMGRGVRVCV